jgi:hypothetical protein
MPPQGGTLKTPHRENVPFSLCAISCGWDSTSKPPHRENVPFLLRAISCIAPGGGTQKIAYWWNTQGFIGKVLFERDLQVAPKKLLDSKTVRFCGKVLFV